MPHSTIIFRTAPTREGALQSAFDDLLPLAELAEPARFQRLLAYGRPGAVGAPFARGEALEEAFEAALRANPRARAVRFEFGGRQVVALPTDYDVPRAEPGSTVLGNGDLWGCTVRTPDEAAARRALARVNDVLEVFDARTLASPGDEAIGSAEPPRWDGRPDAQGVNLDPLRKLVERDLGRLGERASIGVIEIGFPSIQPDVDLEDGSTQTEDAAGATLGARTHGQKTLAVLRSNLPSVPMIAPYATFWLAQIGDGGQAIARLINFIKKAPSRLPVGSILLLEVEGVQEDGRRYPIIFAPEVLAVINSAVYAGLIVVVPACNSPVEIRDSANFAAHAIVVGGVVPGVDEARGDTARLPAAASSSGFGARVDCCAWAEQVPVGFDDITGPAMHTGTSAASAEIAGAIAMLQGWVALRRSNHVLFPETVRALLREHAGEVAVFSEGGWTRSNRHVGGLPDFGAIAAAIEDIIDEISRPADPPPEPEPPRQGRPRRRCRRRVRR